MKTIDLYHELKKIVDLIPFDFGGGCPISKSTLMGYLALKNDLKTYVEIGVYRGRSFFPMARVMQFTGGIAYGVDPYSKADAVEYDVDQVKKSQIDEFINNTDFSQIFAQVSEFQQTVGLSNCSEIIPQKSSDAIEYFRENHVAIDMLHIDGNHDTAHVLEDLDLYLPLVKAGGYIVLDDTDWGSVKAALNKVIIYQVGIVLIEDSFAILQKKNTWDSDTIMDLVEPKRLAIIYNFIKNISGEPIPRQIIKYDPSYHVPTVSVLIVSYNHEAYINEAIESILAQQGEFNLELIVADDFSKDRTLTIINEYIKLIKGNPRYQVKVLADDHNIGLERNYQRALEACSGEYFAVCEGDDYWLSVDKLQLQIEFMKSHPYCSFCFHDMLLYWQDRNEFERFEVQEKLASKELFSTKDLVSYNFIGNFTVCLYDVQFVKSLPQQLFDLDMADWMFNILYSLHGQIGHLPLKMSVYRKHKAGLWTGKARLDSYGILHKAIDDYNKFLDYEYDEEFRLTQQIQEASGFVEKKVDLLVLDDFFPDPISGFRWQEFLSYLAEFPSIAIVSTGDGRIQHQKAINYRQLVSNFKKSFPGYANKLVRYFPELNYQAKVISIDFLNIAYRFIDHIERLAAPFVFTLYPGGGFQLDDLISDNKLQRVMSSPCFRKVIVTQQVTYDYLLDHHFCTPDQIQLIFGVVIPQGQFELTNYEKHYFGIDKETLDICFVAHRYTDKGLQKGYDVFIEVAHLLSRLHPNIYFHVVGGFDETIFDVSEIKDRITFYGVRDEAWFNDFYRNMDLILAPNINGAEFNGSFDGFPTGACVDAGLRNTAIFSTDELHLNNQYFSDGQEIVIIPHDAAKITTMIDTYYQDPLKLKAISINGRQKILQLYGYEAQISPRVRLLKNEIELSDISKRMIVERLHQRELLAKKAMIPLQVQGVAMAESSSNIPGRLMSFLRKGYRIIFIQKEVNLLRKSEYFDEKWYLENNPDVAAAKLDPYRHYLRHGAYEGRNPSPRFDSRRYLDTNPDVRRFGINPLVHYLKFGQFEGRMPKNDL